MMKDKHILVDNIEYAVVATVYDDITKKDYVVFTDKNFAQKKDLTLSCTLYHEENGNLIPEKITDKEDKEAATEIIKEVMNKLNNLIKK